MSTESTIRRKAIRRGYVVRKSRWRKHTVDNRGDYMLVDFRNIIRLGERFDATLEEIDAFLRDIDEAPAAA